MPAQTAAQIAEARAAEIARRQALLKERFPEIYKLAKEWAEEFPGMTVRNVRSLRREE